MYDFDIALDRSGTSAIKTIACKSVFGSEDVVPMWVADMDLATAPEITEALVARAQHGIYGYTAELDDDYNAILGWLDTRFGVRAQREWVMWSTNVVTGIRVAINALTQPGDRVVIETPVYTPFFDVVKDAGRTLRCSRLINDDGYYTMDFDDLENAFRGGARAIVLCSPHNPVGRVWSYDEMEKLVALCKKYDVLLISDEIHDGFIFRGHAHTSVLKFDYENTVMLMSASKSFNLAGLEISNMIVRRKDYREKIGAFMRGAGVADGANNVFGSVAQRTAYSKCGKWLDEATDYIEANVDATIARLSEKMPLIKCRKQEGTYLMWLDISALGTCEKVFKALCEAGVGLNKGDSYGEEGANYMRFNVACPRAQLEKALGRMEKAYATLTA